MRKIDTCLLRGVLRLLALLPLRVHYALGRVVEWLAHSVVRYRRDVVDHNLALCFPERNEAERKRIRKDFYRHFGELVAETVWFGGCHSAERLHRKHLVEVENPEEAARLFAGAPSILVLYSHCGNWELLGGIASYNYTDTPLPFTEQNFCVVYRKQSSAAWDAVLRDNRTAPLEDRKHFGGYIETQEIVRYAFTHRGERKAYHVNTDQRPYASSMANVEVDFMGRRVWSMTGAAALARKFQMPVLYQSMRRESRGHYKIRYTPLCADASQIPVEALMQQYYVLLERDLRDQPSNYLWTHRRFERPKHIQTQ